MNNKQILRTVIGMWKVLTIDLDGYLPYPHRFETMVFYSSEDRWCKRASGLIQAVEHHIAGIRYVEANNERWQRHSS